MEVQSEVQERVLRRGQALHDLRTARRHLRLRRDCRVPATRYRGWKLANDALVGEPLGGGALQRSRHRVELRARRAFEDYLPGLRLWLRAEPASRMPVDYNDFVREHNTRQRRAKTGSGQRRLVLADSI